MLKIDGVQILGLEINLCGEKTVEDILDLGALTLRSDDREYILDAVASNIEHKNGDTEVSVKLAKDEEIFSDCKYDLTSEDLMFNVNGEFYISSDLHVDSITLFVKFEGGMTKAIDIREE